VRDCLVAWPGVPQGQRVAAGAALAEVALDRGDLPTARAWLPAPGAQSDDPLERLQLARLAVAANDPAAPALLAALPQKPRRGTTEPQRALRWQADAVRAEWRCRRGEAASGRDLRAQVLAEAERLEPERTRLRRRLGEMSAACR
jgi:hypothetical protein